MNIILERILRRSCCKIGIFLIIILVIMVFSGFMMYYIEGKNNGFSTIALAVYWAFTTLITVGYGDITPQTGSGRTIAILLQTLGYTLFIIPVIVVLYEIVNAFLDEFTRTGNKDT